MAMCIACVAFGQNTSLESTRAETARYTQLMDDAIIAKAILLHRSFSLTDNSLGLLVITAGGVNDDGKALTLTGGVEFTTHGVVVTADELIYDWATHRIEPRGNVRLKPLPLR
jgi:lipopolysaccharide assembly outer membrane protein LptD (OstA)